MSTTRTKTIEALEKLRADAQDLLNWAISINEHIRSNKLPIPPIDLPMIYSVEMRADVLLTEIELRAIEQGSGVVV